MLFFLATSRVVDPFFYLDPDPNFHFNADPGPAPQQTSAYLQPLVYRLSTASF